MTGGAAIAALVAVVLAILVFRSQRVSPAAFGYAVLAALTSVACGALIGWLATPYTPNGTLDDLAAAFGGGGGVGSVVFGAYLWLPVGALALAAWLACSRAARRGRAGSLGVCAGVGGAALSALGLTVSDRPVLATALAALGAAAALVVLCIEVSARRAS